jgi:hypothetical protein
MANGRTDSPGLASEHGFTQEERLKESGDRRQSDARDQAAAFYLQVVAIIQSLALGFLLTAVGERLTNQSSLYSISNYSSINTQLVWLQIIAVFNVIVLTWALSAHGVIQFKRDMTLADSYNPFLLGVTQFFLVYFISAQTTYLWFLAMALFSINAVVLQVHVHRRRNLVLANKAALEKLRQFRPLGVHVNTFLIIFMTAWACILAMGGLSSLEPRATLGLLLSVNGGLGVMVLLTCRMLRSMALRAEVIPSQ